MRTLIVNVKKMVFSLCFLLFFAYIIWHLSGFLTSSTHLGSKINISSISISWSGFLNFKTIFLSIIIEAMPFILIGVLVSALLQNFVSEEQIKKFLPGNKYAKILLACLVGILFPVCECGIVPVARRLVSKGVPLYSAVTFMLAAPIINPVVASSTAVAFSANPSMVCYRLGLAFFVSFGAGFLVSFFFDGGELRAMPYNHCACGCTHGHDRLSNTLADKLISTLRNACDEFFEMGKYLILGACLAAFVQTAVSRDVLFQIGQGLWSSIAAMMAFAFGISVCSSADAFIAASFAAHFTTGSLLAFMVFGPMIDVKNVFMMLNAFKLRFVVMLTISVGLLVLYGAYLFNFVTVWG